MLRTISIVVLYVWLYSRGKWIRNIFCIHRGFYTQKFIAISKHLGKSRIFLNQQWTIILSFVLLKRITWENLYAVSNPFAIAVTYKQTNMKTLKLNLVARYNLSFSFLFSCKLRYYLYFYTFINYFYYNIISIQRCNVKLQIVSLRFAVQKHMSNRFTHQMSLKYEFTRRDYYIFFIL